MRFSLFVIACIVVACHADKQSTVNSEPKPLISVSSAYHYLSTSASLGLSMGQFAVSKVVSLLPPDAQKQYNQIISKIKVEISKLVDQYHAQVESKLQPVIEALYVTVEKAYLIVSDKINPSFDKLIAQFELASPQFVGSIGSSLADRVLMIVWLYVAAKIIKRIIFLPCCILCPKRKAASTATAAAGGKKRV